MKRSKYVIGMVYVLAEIRKRFWIIKGRAAAHCVIGHYFDCKKRLQPRGKQKMAHLLVEQITPGQPHLLE